MAKGYSLRGSVFEWLIYMKSKNMNIHFKLYMECYWMLKVSHISEQCCDEHSWIDEDRF